MKYLFLIAALLGLSQEAGAAIPRLPDLSQQNLDKIAKEISANNTYTNASAPKTFGKRLHPDLGFQIGVVGGLTKVPDLDTLVSTENIPTLPHAGVHLGVSFPYGLMLESNFLPTTKISDVNISYFSLAGRWVITDTFWEWLPFHWGVLAHYGKSTLNYNQTVNNSSTSNTNLTAKIDITNSIWGLNTSVGYSFFDMIEPYAGIGFLIGNATVAASGSATVTVFSFTSAQSASSKPSSVQLFGGVQFDLFIVKLGVEAMRAFGTNNYSANFSFNF